MSNSTPYILYLDDDALNEGIKAYKDSLPELSENEQDPLSAKKSPHANSQEFVSLKFDASLLQAAQEYFEALIKQTSQEASPLVWAESQSFLGSIRFELGKLKNERGLVEQSIQSFELALGEFSADNSPQLWASTLSNMADAVQHLAISDEQSKQLSKAIDAYTDCMTVWTRDDAPVKWAASMSKIGVSFYHQGKARRGERTFEKSMASFRNALAVLTLEESPREWAVAQNNLAVVLHVFAEREEDSNLMKEALEAYENAKLAWNHQMIILNLGARIMLNRAIARKSYAKLTKDLAIAEEAMDDLTLVEVFGSSLDEDYRQLTQVHLEEATALFESLSS